MKEFTFNCSTCGQPILAKKDWSGRRMNCPSCNTRLTISAPTKAPTKKKRITSTAKTGPKPPGGTKRLLGFP